MVRSFPRSFRLVAPSGAALLAFFAGTVTLSAQESSQEWLDRCNERNGAGRTAFCELREATIAAPARLDVNAGPNGGIDVSGSGRSDIHVTARIQAWGDTDAEARGLARQVDIETGGGRIAASGPSMRNQRGRGWSVSYVVATPGRIDLELGTVNGGLSVTGVEGALSLRTTNGGIRMEDVGGTVDARTTNGGVNVHLTGNRWAGEGLELQTTNGSIRLTVPERFAASVTARTVNGRIHTDFPVTVQGTIDRNLNAQLGGGGPPVRLATTNGGIELRRK